MQIRRGELPDSALPSQCQRDGSYVDCYATEIDRLVSHADFVEAFHTSRVFKLERLILAWFVARPSTDAQARDLASGKTDAFAAWHVEGRASDQLLMRDFTGRTLSWLMTVPTADKRATRLYFGSAMVPVVDRRTGQQRMGFGFRALLGFHQLYSRVLLRAAAYRLVRAPSRQA